MDNEDAMIEAMPDIDFRAHAESMGAVAVKVSSIADLETAIQQSKGNDRTSEEIAWDSHDTHDLSAEESAMHYEEDGGEEELLSDDVLHDLESFED